MITFLRLVSDLRALRVLDGLGLMSTAWLYEQRRKAA